MTAPPKHSHLLVFRERGTRVMEYTACSRPAHGLKLVDSDDPEEKEAVTCGACRVTRFFKGTKPRFTPKLTRKKRETRGRPRKNKRD